jgi:hypothetical protein
MKKLGYIYGVICLVMEGKMAPEDALAKIKAVMETDV